MWVCVSTDQRNHTTGRYPLYTTLPTPTTFSIQQQRLVAFSNLRSTCTRSGWSCGSFPWVLSRIASANSRNARSMLIFAFADVSMKRIPCSRAICWKKRAKENWNKKTLSAEWVNRGLAGDWLLFCCWVNWRFFVFFFW